MSGPRSKDMSEIDDGIKTYIQGFDKLMDPPSLPKNTTILVSGPMGSGKTTFIIDYIVKGLIRDKHFGIFVSLEETVDNIIKDYQRFLWGTKEPNAIRIRDLILTKEHLETTQSLDGKLLFIDGVKKRVSGEFGIDFRSAKDITDLISEDGIIYLYDISDLCELLDAVLKIAVEKYGVKYIRLGLDSLTAYLSAIAGAIGLGGSQQGATHEFAVLDALRRNLLDLRNVLESYPVTALMSGEAFKEEQTRYGVEEFISRGVIFLGYLWMGSKRIRYLTIVKMRGRQHQMARYSFEINIKYGIRLLSEVF